MFCLSCGVVQLGNVEHYLGFKQAQQLHVARPPIPCCCCIWCRFRRANKAAYAAAIGMLVGWVFFRFVGPNLGLYQLAGDLVVPQI